MRRKAFAALVAASTLLALPAAAQERWQSFRDDASGLFGLFGSRDDEQHARGTGGGAGEVYAQAGSGELIVRLERLENQIRQLTGSIEQLQFRNQQLEQQLRRTQEDVDFRFQEATGKAAPARSRPAPPAQAAPPPPAVPAAPAPGRRSDAFDPSQHPHAPGAPQTLGAVAAAPPVGGPPPVIVDDEPGLGAPGGRAAGAPLDLGRLSERPPRDGEGARAAPPAVAAVPGDGAGGALPPPPPRNPSGTGAPPQQTVLAPSATPKDEFALAYGYLQRKDYALAEESLRAFLKKHPHDRQVADAHFWLGESLYQRQRYRDAAESFLAVSTKFEKSAKAPDALLRLGQSLTALGEREAGCATLREVVRKYPGAPAAVKQSVDREQKRAKC